MAKGTYKRTKEMNTGKYIRSKETKNKMSEVARHSYETGRIHPRYWSGKHLSEEHKKNISFGGKGKHIGIIRSKEQKAKQSETMKRLFSEGKLVHHLKGKTKEDYEPLRIISEKSSKTRKRLIQEGKLNTLNNLGKYAIKGWKMDESIKEKIRIKNLRIKHSEEWKKNIVESRKNNGRVWTSNKTKEKIREARKRQIVPKKDSSIEVKIQGFLESLGIDYFKHKYMNIEHGYQCDIFIPSLNLVIECDGDYWHKYPTGKEIDHIRTSELLSKGFKVLRLWECEIKEMNLDKFKEELNHE